MACKVEYNRGSKKGGERERERMRDAGENAGKVTATRSKEDRCSYVIIACLIFPLVRHAATDDIEEVHNHRKVADRGFSPKPLLQCKKSGNGCGNPVERGEERES